VFINPVPFSSSSFLPFIIPPSFPFILSLKCQLSDYPAHPSIFCSSFLSSSFAQQLNQPAFWQTHPKAVPCDLLIDGDRVFV
jgi:hypothetical protein